MYSKIILFLLLPIFAFSQSPQKINFQSILRNTIGEVVSNKSVSLKISILSGSISGLTAYSETHTKTTDAAGLISLQVGNGTVLSGVFANISWGNAPHFIKLEVDFSGGSNYVLLGTQELMSVPYALYASKTDTSALNLTSRLATKLNATDTVSLSNRINANANSNSGSFDTSLLNLTSRLATKLNVTDTASLSNRINEKALINNPTFTGTVGGISKAMVGLGNVDNTSDANKPISTATQTGLNNKVNVSDTSDMLNPYLRKADAIGSVETDPVFNTSIAKGITGIDTAYWNRKLNTTDTSNMLSNYRTGLNNKVNIADTSLMLNPYLRKSDSIIADLLNQDKLLQSFSNVTDIDGNKYKTVKIGTQIWMSENLKTSRYRNGDIIPVVTDNTAWIGLTSGARCWYENDSSTYENNYGNLYNSFAATELRGICPLGWHLPTYQEWETLTYFLGGTGNGGGKMKYSGTTFWSNPNTDANNESGFSALPGGYRSNNGGGGSFSQIGKDFWMVLKGELNVLHFRNLHYTSNSISGPNAFGYWNHFNETSGVSIRCLKDAEIDINQSLNLKVNIADTSDMLNPYLRKSDVIVSVENDPIFNASIAKGISSIDTAYWNRKTGNTTGSMQYWNGTTWVNLAPGLPGQILSTDNTGKPVWLSALPLISTNSVSDINPNAATCGGNIISDGGSPVTDRGVVWSINPNPTISLSTKTSNGLGIGVFTSSMTGLTSNVVYYVRSYVTNSVGTSYGNEIVFTTTANIPMLTTTSVQSITTNGAISGGNISSDGGSPVTVRGTVWSTSANPTVALSTKTSDGSGLGTFSSAITGLSPNTTYYVRSYASNMAGTGYGNEMTFTTEIGAIPPTVTTSSASEVSYLTFTTGGNVTFDGGSTVTARGIIWSQTQNPTISLPTKTVNGSGNGLFTSYMFDLTPNTVYYVRSYATNSAGTGYGMTDTVQTRAWVNCPGNITDIDNNVYNVVTIGYQCWTKENLKVSRYKNGDEIPVIINDRIWESQTSGMRCWYGNDSTGYEDPFGNLYNWYAVDDVRGLCPTGWHVPSDVEWSTLTDYLGGRTFAGGKMKSIGTSSWISPNVGATNETLFTGQPGGSRYSRGNFVEYRNQAFFFSSTGVGGNAWFILLYASTANSVRTNETDSSVSFKSFGGSVRCLRD